MTLSSIHSSGRTMKNFDSKPHAGGPIAVSMQKHASRSKRVSGSLKAALVLVILSMALFAPGQAFAGNPNCDNATSSDATEGQYCNPVESLQAGLGSGQGGGPAEEVAVPAASGPSLPFTGLDVAALAVVALALAGTGVVLRRLATIGDSEK
jgi:hypothetical protein